MKSNKTCYILVAEGFNEKSIMQTAEFFWPSRVDLTFLSLYSSPTIKDLAAKYGAGYSPQLLLGDLEEDGDLPNGLLIAGGYVCGQHLLIDPRFHRLLNRMWFASKPVGFLYPIFVPLFDTLPTLLTKRSLFLFQERLKKEAFLNNFMYQLFAHSPSYQTQTATLQL